MNHRKKIGVVRGGPSNEYEVSLDTGAAVLDALRKYHENRFDAKDIFIDRKGNWHVDGMPMVAEKAITSVDLIFNALHGKYGEDGKVQSLLENYGRPFTGSGSLASSIGMNKILCKKIFKDNGIRTPHFKEFRSSRIETETDEIVRELFQTFLMPAVVKPVSSGSSVGVKLVRYYDGLHDALNEATKYDDTVMVEEYIPGIEATCAVIERFRGQGLYALPAIEVRPANGSDFYDYNAKYVANSELVCPGNFNASIKSELEMLAKSIHRALGLRHYSRSDFIIHPRRGIYVLEVNTLPGLTKHSHLPAALKAVGSDLGEFVGHVVALSMEY